MAFLVVPVVSPDKQLTANERLSRHPMSLILIVYSLSSSDVFNSHCVQSIVIRCL